MLQDAARFPGTPGRAILERWARHAFGGTAGELVLRIVSAAESAALNERYRGKPGPTNVLAFEPDPDSPGSDEPAALGDLVVCAELVRQEASEQGKPPEAHWAHLLVHGCLHLQGYDHMNEAEAAAMEARERELLAGLGIPDPYAPPG